MGDERGVRALPVHARRRSIDEQAARNAVMVSLRRATLFKVAGALLTATRLAAADPPAAVPSSAPALPAAVPSSAPAASPASPAVNGLAAAPIPAPNGTPVDFDSDKPLLRVYV